MSKRLMCAMMVALVWVPGLAVAQETVLSRVPADAVGFVVIRNLNQAGAKVDKFIADIGLGQQMPGNVLPLVLEQLRIKEGLNLDGGVALAMLDPAKFGWDIPELIKTERPPQTPPPVVLIIPGAEPMKILAAYQPQEVEGLVQFQIGSQRIAAKAVGAHTVLALSPDLIRAVEQAAAPITAKMTAVHADIVSKADLAVWVDMKTVAQAMVALMEKSQEQMKLVREHVDPGVRFIFDLSQGFTGMAKDVYGQMEAITLAVRLTKAGPVLEFYSSYLPDTMLARIVSGVKVSGVPLDRLPALQYVLAMGGQGVKPADPQAQAMAKEMMDKLSELITSAEFLRDVPEETRQRAFKALGALGDQIEGFQCYLGGPGEGPGLFGAACVMKVKQAQPVKDALAELTAVGDELIHTLAKPPEEVKITYVRNAVGSADAIVLKLEKELAPDEREEMTKILGEDRVAMYVASPDQQTVVISFGGGQRFLAQALQAAAGNKGLIADPSVQAVLKDMPADLTGVALINLSNLLALVKSGAQTMGVPLPRPLREATMECKLPIVLAQSVRGNGEYGVLLVPTELVADIVKAVTQFMAAMQSPAASDGGF